MGSWKPRDTADWIIITIFGAAILFASLAFLFSRYETETQAPTYPAVVVERYPEYIVVDPVPEDPSFIVVDSLGLRFTEREYHDRVRRQIDESGHEFICFNHLRTLDLAVLYDDANALRIFTVLVEECAVPEEAFTTIE